MSIRLRLAKLIAGKHWPDPDEQAVQLVFAMLPAPVVMAAMQAVFDPGEQLTLTPASWFEE